MRKVHGFNMLLMFGLLAFAPAWADECDRCEEQGEACEEKCECTCNRGKGPCGYNPMCRYYPYCSIYQHSCVREEKGDIPAASWPGRRDGSFSDSLAR